MTDSKLEKMTSFNSKNEVNEIELSLTEKSKENHFVPSPEERKLVKKLNYTFMPFVCMIVFIQFLDKTALSNISVIPEFFTDTGINEDQYSWLGSMFYFGFLCMQLPNNVMMQKFPISKYLGVVLVVWGVSLFCMAFAHNFSQLAALRFLLGFFEATTYPCLFLLIATMYRRSEQVLWFGVLFMSNSVAMILGGVIGAGIMKMPTVGTISPWKWTFVIFGSITTLMGFVYFFFLPDKNNSKWFRLTEEEKAIVQDRARDNAVVPTLEINYNHIKEALKEPRFYCYCLISLFIELQNGALTIFSGIIIRDLGFSNFNAVLLTIPSGVFSFLLTYFATSLSKRTGEIIYIAMGTCCLSLIGLTCLAAIPTGGVKLLGLYLSWGATITYTLMQASISSNVSGYTKKIFYTSGNLIFYTVGNFIGPLLLRSQDSPRYLPGMGVYIAANILVLLLFSYIRYSYVMANKKRRLGNHSVVEALPDKIEDCTDAENPNFVYRT